MMRGLTLILKVSHFENLTQFSQGWPFLQFAQIVQLLFCFFPNVVVEMVRSQVHAQ